MRILVIGAGLGGLTAGIALRRHGFRVEIHEAANRLEETGAGLTLGLGAQHVFRALGLQDDVAARACPAGNLPFLHYRTGAALLGALDLGDGHPDDGAADIVRHIYRADLQEVLIDAFVAAGGKIHTGHRLSGCNDTGSDVTAHFANGDMASGDVLIGADGVRSTVRGLLRPGDAPRFTDHVAYRFLVPMDEARPFMDLGRSAIFIGPQRTFNRYTMSGGRIVNCAGLVESTEPVAEGWSIGADRDELRAAFAGWHPDVTGLIEKAGSIIKWGLYDRAPLDSWTRGRVTLLGDAAHAMLPFLGMGAAMAIEDGWALGEALALETDPAAALARYEAARLPRTALLQAKSAEQGRVTQAIDPDNLKLAGAPVNDRAMMAFDPVAAGV